MVHRIARQLPQFEARFTPYYCDGFKRLVCRAGLLDFTVMGGQGGMTDPETLAFHLVKVLKLFRRIAQTAATGLSDSYAIFCVARRQAALLSAGI